jgi:putative transcriptional regulator
MPLLQSGKKTILLFKEAAMAIIVNLDVMLAKRKLTSLELSQRVGITPANLSILKTGKAKAIRMSTLEAICRELKCQPGDLLEYTEDDDPWKR